METVISCMTRVPYNKLFTKLACLSHTAEYWPSFIFVRTLLCLVHTAMISGQCFPVWPLCLVSKRLKFSPMLTFSKPSFPGPNMCRSSTDTLFSWRHFNRKEKKRNKSLLYYLLRWKWFSQPLYSPSNYCLCIWGAKTFYQLANVIARAKQKLKIDIS